MAEPSRPPPPKAYVPSKKPGVPPSRPSAGPARGQTELPIPPRPALEDIPPVSPTDLTKSKSGRGPPPPPAPYSKKPLAAKLSDGAEDETDKGQAPPKSRPPAPRPAKAPAGRPSKPPASSSKKMDITIVSAQPMTSDVIPPPAKGATPTTDPPMPTEPPPEPPTEVRTPPPKPNRSPPIPKAVLDKESEPLPKRGPAPPKPVRGSPPLPPRGVQDDQGSGSPKEVTDRPSRGSPHVRKAPPPPAGRTRPPPPQSKAPPIPSTEAPSEYTALIPTATASTTSSTEYMVPQAPPPASEYTEPVSSKTLSKSSLPSADYIEPVSDAKSGKPTPPVHKAPPPPVSRPSAPPMSRSRPPPTSRAPPPPTQGKKEEGPRDVELSTHVYAEVSPSTSQTSLGEATPISKDVPPPVPSSPRPSAQPKLTDSKTTPPQPKKSPPTKPPSSKPRPPPPQVKKEEVTEDKATPTAAPTARPRPPLPRTTSKDDGVKATPTPRSRPPPPVATPPEETNETPPTSRPRPPPPKAAPPTPEKDKTPPTSRPRPPPPKTKTDKEDQDKEKTPPPSKPHPPKPIPRQDSGGEVKAQPPMKPKPRPKKIPSVSSVEETETTPTNVETARPTEPVQDEVKKEATPPVGTTRPPPKKPPVAPKRSISKTDSSDEPLPSDTPIVRETSPPPAKPRPPPQTKPRPPPPKSKEDDKTEGLPPRSLSTSAPPTRPTSGPTKAPPPSRPGQGPKPKPTRPPGVAPPKPTPPVPSTRSKPPNKDGPPVPTARRGTASKEDSDAPPLPPRPEPGHPLYRYVCPNPHGIARTNKEAPDDDELSYYEGDVIELLEKVDDHWYYACNADNDMQEGLILAKEMKIIKRLPGQDKVMEDGPCAVAMSTFEGRSSDELSFKEGTLIMLISRVGGDEWLRGRTLKGEEGIFPKSFVEVVEDLPPDAIEEIQPASPEYDIPDGPYCIATETFVGESPDDLSFDAGDLIEITERIDDSWLRGTTHGKSGMFPQVFVDVKVDTPVGVVGGGGGGEGGGGEREDENVVKALFDYDGEEGDLSFKGGDMITLLSKVSDEWIYGRLDGREGMFPSSFISHVPESLPLKTTEEEPKVDEATPTPEPPKTPTGECEALYDYESDNHGDLSFTAGEKIVLTEWINDEWCNGTIGDRAGIFPLSFVKIIKDLPKDTGLISKAAAPKSQKKVQQEELSDLMPKAKAIRNFEPASSLEMRLQTGDMIILLAHEGKGMYSGENVTTGEFGNFPANCVEVIVPLP